MPSTSTASTLPPPVKCVLPDGRINPDTVGAVVSYGNGLVLEETQRASEFDIWDNVQKNTNLFLKARALNRPTGKYRANKIQNSVMSNWGIQIQTPPKPRVRQRMTGEPRQWYFQQSHASPELTAQMPPDTYSYMQHPGGEVTPPRPLQPPEIALVQQQILQSRMLQAQGLAGTADAGCLVALNDSTIRAALEEVLESKFIEADGVDYWRENELYNNIFGWQALIMEWDDDTHLPVFRNPEPVCVHIDPTRTDVSQAAYVIYDEFLGKDEALQRYQSPEMQQAIRTNAHQGAPTLAGQIPYRLPAYWLQRYFYRETVIVRTMWIRNQPYPLTAQEAIDAGKIIQAPPEGNPLAGDTGLPETPVEADAGGEPQGEGSAGSQTVPQEPGAGEVSPELVPPVEPTYYLVTHGVADETKPIEPTDPEWPVRYAIRQIRIVASQVYDDRECERTNIPVGHNVNIPIPWVPWGQGEPERLERLQEAHNNVLTDTVVNGEFSTTAAGVYPRSVGKDNPALTVKGYTEPGRLYPVDDAVWHRFGADQGKPLIQFYPPPPAPADQYRREEMLSRLIDNTSDYTDARRGVAPGQSGEAIQLLQSAGNSIPNAKAMRSERMLRYLFKVLAGDIILRMTPEQLAQDFPKFEVHVWQELKRRLLKHYLFCDLEVDVAAGGGAARSQNAQRLINARAAQVPVSDPEIMESMDLDPDDQLQKQADYERLKATIMQGILPTPTPTAAGQPGQPQPTGAA